MEYVEHLTGCYSLRFIEKHTRAILPQWVGWYNPYDYSFSYEYFDSITETYIRRVIPIKIRYVLEFGFIDLNLGTPRDEGIVIYRQQSGVYWLRFSFGYGVADRDDVIIEGPFKYNDIIHPYYLYVHDVPYFFQGKKITYLFVTDPYIKVFYFYNDDPGTILEVDMTEVTGFRETEPLYHCTDARISKTAFFSLGIHGIYHYPATVPTVTYARNHIYSLSAYFDAPRSRILFRSNLPSLLYYVDGIKDPEPGVDPFIVLQDRVDEGFHIYHEGYVDTSFFLEENTSYKGYETDLEWISGVVAITVEAGGFAYILLI